MFLKRGQPKSLFRPGSSTVVLLLEKNRTGFCQDIVDNLCRCDAVSMFARGFGMPMVETDVRVRETVAQRADRAEAAGEAWELPRQARVSAAGQGLGLA